MKEIQSIELVLENCEVIKIDQEHMIVFGLSQFKRKAYKYGKNLTDLIIAEESYFQIHPKANNMSSYSTEWSDQILPFKRLTEHHDLVSVDINYTDGSNEYIYLGWGGESDYLNEYQQTHIDPIKGDLIIVVNAKKDLHSRCWI